jgi:RNA polymerase sigma-70 factor (ECF subfamily)
VYVRDTSDQQPAEALRAGLAEGREAAYAGLYDRLGRRLFRAAVSILRSPQDAEDVVQEVFMNLYRARASLGRVENVTGYVFAMLRHAAARRLRQMGAARRAAAAAADAARLRGADPPPDGRTAALERALDALPPAQREVIALKVDAGLTFAEIGAALGVSLNTAASRYRYALEKLRATLGRDP